MADNVIDLTQSPPRPSNSSRSERLIRLRALSARRARARRTIRALYLEHCGSYINQQMASLIQRRLAELNSALSQIVNSFHDDIRDYHAITELAVASLYRHVISNLYEAWIPREHELFMMELMRYYRSRMSEVSWNYVWSTTSPQVQRYAESFFRHQPIPSTYSYSNMDQTYAPAIAADHIRRTENLISASNLFSNPMNMIPNEQQPSTLTLFREEALNSSIPPADEGNGYTQMHTRSVDSTLVTSSNEVELDLELSLG